MSTTTGSIDGKVSLNIAEFLEKVEIVKREARSLGNEEPTVRVDANTSPAISGMAKVEAAAKAMGATTTNANRQIGDSASSASARTQLIVAAVVGLTAVAGPATGAALGLAGGLAGLGAVGVLGIVGVVQAIKQGTQAGAEWSAGLKTLKADLSQLAGTAAAGLLSTFQRSVALINQSMPELNSQVAGFSRILAGAGMSTLQGVINALHILNPLFMQGAGVIQDMASGFASWTSNGGLQKFADYAQSVLPQVIHTVGDLAAAILHITEATAPIGTVVLGILDGLARAVNAIPTPVLTGLAAAAAAVYVGFNLWTKVPGLANGVTKAVEALGGTMRGLSLAGGAVGVALTALVMIFAAVAQANAEADARAQSYAGTLDKMTGATTNATRQMAVDQLSAKTGFMGLGDSAFEAAKKIGVSAKTMTDAYLGVPSAVQAVDAAVAHANKGSNDSVIAALYVTDSLKQGAAAARDGAEAWHTQADAMSGTAAASDAARAALQATRPAADRLAEAARGIGTAAEHSVDALNALAQASLGNAQADLRYQETLTQTNATLQQAAGNFDITTEAGQRNMGALYDLAGAALAAEDAQKKAGLSSDEIAAKMQTAHDQFVNAAVGAGMGASEAENLANKLGLIPPNTTANVTANTSTAQGVIDSFINRNDGRVVNIVTSVQGQYAQVAGQLGKSTAYAYGGTANVPGAAYGVTGGTVRGSGSAWSDTAGLYRLANGEEVVSNTVGQAGRYRPLLKAMSQNAPAAQVAGQAARMAGVSAAPSQPATIVNNITVHVTGVQQEDPMVLGRIVGGDLKRAMAGVRK